MGDRKMGAVKKFGYNKQKYIMKVIGGAVEMLVCIVLASALKSNVNIFNYGVLSRLSSAFYLLGFIYFALAVAYAYGYYQMNLEIGTATICGKAWDRELKVLPSMPKFFQIDAADIAKVENKRTLTIYTKQGKEYYLYLDRRSEAYQLLEQGFDEYDMM